MKNLITLAKTTINNLKEYDTRITDDDKTLGTTIGNIITAIIGILGLVCVVIIIIGGIGYMTSSGDAGKVKKAKDTILYACIGLIVCALSFAIVNWVIKAIS